MEAAVAGAGIGYLASGYVDRRVASGELVSLLTEWCPAMPSLTLYYPRRRPGRRAARA